MVTLLLCWFANPPKREAEKGRVEKRKGNRSKRTELTMRGGLRKTMERKSEEIIYVESGPERPGIPLPSFSGERGASELFLVRVAMCEECSPLCTQANYIFCAHDTASSRSHA